MCTSAKNVPFGSYELMHILAYVLLITLSCAHFAYATEAAMEYVKLFFMTSVAFIALISYLSYRLNTQKVFKIIDALEQAINKSELWLRTIFQQISKKINKILGLERPESKAMYEKINQLAEKLSKLAVFFFRKVSIPFVIIPTTVKCYFTYYTTDLGTAAFELPIPMWWGFLFDWRYEKQFVLLFSFLWKIFCN